MNGIRCPQCSLVNSLSATECAQCKMPFGNLPPTAYVSVPVEQTYAAQGLNFSIPIDPENELGRKTFFWYRFYLGFCAVLYLLVTGMGIFLVVFSSEQRGREAQEMLLMGTVYGILGAVFFLVYCAALFFPRKSWNWIAGIVFIALGLTSCCLWPGLIPLLIYWIKPETKVYMGRQEL